MKICVAGAMGAFGSKHLDALARIEDIEVVSVVGGPTDNIEEFASQRGIVHATRDLNESLSRTDVEAFILATPTGLHAEQTIACMNGGKHVLCEIPMADTLKDAKKVVEVQRQTGIIAMVDHVRRFNPSHQWIHRKVLDGDLSIQHLDVQTYFFRRTNTNAKGEPRTWTDHLLWHHACHTVDLFQYQTGGEITDICGLQGPTHPQLGIAMDLSIGMKSENGAVCSLSLSFNNEGPFGTNFRYICDNGTYIARYDELFDGNENQIDLSGIADSNDGVELADREFIAAIREQREPNSSVGQCIKAMETLDRIEKSLV